MVGASHLFYSDERVITSQHWNFYDDSITSHNTGPLDATLMGSSDMAHVHDVAHVTCRKWCVNLTWQGGMSQIQRSTCRRPIGMYVAFLLVPCHLLTGPRVTIPRVHVSHPISPCVAFLLVPGPPFYWSTCCLPTSPHVIVLLVHVWPSGWSMCHHLIGPRVTFLLIHASPSYWFSCHLPIGSRVTFLLFQVPPSFGSTWRLPLFVKVAQRNEIPTKCN